MKKIIFGIAIGVILCCSVVYAASYYASDISYEPSDASWEVNNVNEAINDLYENSNKIKYIEFALGEGTNIGGASGYRGTMRFDTKWFQDNVESLWVRNCASSNVYVEIYYNGLSTYPYSSYISGGSINNTTSEYKKLNMIDVDSNAYKYTWVIASSGNNEYMAAAEIKLDFK